MIDLFVPEMMPELLNLKRRVSNTVAFLIYPIVFFFIFNGEVFMELYLGNKYIQSGTIFSIYNLAVLIRINSYSDILMIIKKPMKIIGPNLISFGAGMILTFILLPVFGINAAAIAFVFAILILSFLLIRNSCKEIGIKIKEYFDFAYLFKLTLVCGVSSFFSYFFMQPTIFSFMLTGAVYLGTVYLILIKMMLLEMNLLPLKIQKIIKRLRV